MKRVHLIKKLNSAGCVLLRHGGKHDIYHNPQTGKTEPVPRHMEIDEFLARKILRSLAQASED
jgi:predicted RNA binding protein YcfA (HicA-like mRNA interferase family)